MQRGTRLGALLTSLVGVLASFGGGQLALAQTEPFVIQDIRVEGLQRISPGSVFAALPVGRWRYGGYFRRTRSGQESVCLRQF